MKRLHKRFLLATFCTLFTATLQAADVTITVNGRVVAKPCTIQTKEANVNLGDLYTRNLQQPGSASGWHNITLSLTDCPIETSANSLIQYDDPAAWTEQEQLLKQMTVENVNTAVKQYLSHPVNTYTGVLLPK